MMQPYDGYPEAERKLFLYLEDHPVATSSQLQAVGFSGVLTKYSNSINELRGLAGVPKRVRGCVLETWEDLKTALAGYLSKNPHADIEAIRRAGYGGVLRHFYGFDVKKAKEELIEEGEQPGEPTHAETVTVLPNIEIKPNEVGKNGNKALLSDALIDSDKAPNIISYVDFPVIDISDPETIIGNSKAVIEMRKMMDRLNGKDADVLVTGETGTGKRLVVKQIHRYGSRSGKPLMVFDCAQTALSEDLLRSQLFGHLKGAFTGAHENRDGYLVAADGGDLVLEELSSLSPLAQRSLLVFYDERVITRVGDTKRIPVDVRIIAVTNHKLEEMVKEGEFSGDLYYRLYNFSIRVPPLRERTEDIKSLLGYFLTGYSKKHGQPQPMVSKGQLKSLEEYEWPGNIREMEKLAERSVISGEFVVPGEIPVVEPPIAEETHVAAPVSDTSVERLSREILDRVPSIDLKQLRDALVQEALRKTEGNQSRAAKLLGMSRYQINHCIRKRKILDQPEHQ